MVKSFCLGVFLILAGSVSAQSPYKNVLIDKHLDGYFSYQPCEPTIAINPRNPANIVAGAIIDRVYVSTDTGHTWLESKLSSRYGVYGDPCVVASSKGYFYYLHLSDPEGKGWASDNLLDRIVCQTSRDQGKTWSSGAGMGENHPKDQDKEWAVCNPKGNRIYATWTQFDKYESNDPRDESNIMFSRSSCKAENWSNAIRINEVPGNCLDDDGTNEGAVPAAGPNGELYVAWALGDTIYFDRSDNGGKSWLSKDIRVTNIIGGWDQKIPGIMRCNGMPVLMCDLSSGPRQGNLYLCWADTRNGENNTDVFFTSSTDKGNTWSPVLRINKDNSGNHQFFPWLAIDQANGNLHVVYYDRRHYDDLRTDVFLATSTDGGATWNEERISESPFVPDAKVFFGDYNNISAHNGHVRPIWTRCDNSKLSVWTAIIKK